MTPSPSDFPASDALESALIPCDSEAVAFEISGGESGLDPELVRHAAAAVLHYFKHDLKRASVTLAEFSAALEQVLRRMGMTDWQAVTLPTSCKALDAIIDLRRFLGDDLELTFFHRLREELHRQLAPDTPNPRLLRCHSLKACVMKLAGARRWSSRCCQLRDTIVEHLRHAVRLEGSSGPVALAIHSESIHSL